MDVYYQTVIPENIYASNIIWTQQVLFKSIYVYTYTCMHVIIANEKEAINLKEVRRGIWKGVKRGNKRKKT